MNAGALSPTLSPALTETERLPIAIGRDCAVRLMLFIINGIISKLNQLFLECMDRPIVCC